MNDFPIDIVLPYVNSDDENWKKLKSNYIDNSNKDERDSIARYRDNGFLRYVFRSIEKNLKFINKIFFIVQQESQLPVWLDRNNPKLRIVYHNEYIPKRHLPTFNANTIECYLYRIPDLSEHFIYINDDIYFLKNLDSSAFFNDDKIVLDLKTDSYNRSNNPYFVFYRELKRNCCKFGLTEHGMYNDEYFYETNHCATSMRKSTAKHLFDYWKDKLEDTFTPLRSTKNVTQLVFHDYEYSINNLVKSNINHVNFRRFDLICKRLRKNIKHLSIYIKLYAKDADSMCIFDTNKINYNIYLECFGKFFEERFPDKSQYELN